MYVILQSTISDGGWVRRVRTNKKNPNQRKKTHQTNKKKQQTNKKKPNQQKKSKQTKNDLKIDFLKKRNLKDSCM